MSIEKEEVVKSAFQTGLIYANLKAVKDDLTMGKASDGLIKLNEIIKYMEAVIIPDYFIGDDVKDVVINGCNPQRP